MSNDEEYGDFLDKANQDTGASGKKQDSKFASTKAVDTEVPGSLQKLDAYYTSDSDEPWEPVALKHNGKDLNKNSFAKLIDHDSSSVDAIDLKYFDPKGKYKNVVDAVSSAGDGVHVVKVFKADHGGTRCEYYLVTINDKGDVVGAKAKAVES